MKYLFSLLLLVSILNASERTTQRAFTLLPGYTWCNPGLGTYGIFSGGEVGITFKSHHYFGLNAHAYNEVDNTVSFYDSLTGKPDITDDTKHYLNVYGAYFYEWSIRQFAILAAGTYIGFKYAEEDRNWDTTITAQFTTKTDTIPQQGIIHLRHEAEGRGLFFGAPAARISFGYRPLYLTILGKLNMGRRENWGHYITRDSSIASVAFDSDYYIEDIIIAKAGKHKNTDYQLFKTFFVMPELTLALMIRF